MKSEELIILLNQEEERLLLELQNIQVEENQIEEDNMWDSIKDAAINGITTALNISDIFESGTTVSSNLNDFQNRSNQKSSELKGKQFDEQKKKICEKAGKKSKTERERFTDYMTGKELIGGDPEKGNYEFDHVISADELKKDKLLGVFLSTEEIRNFLNSEKNIAPTDKEINNKKNNKTWPEFIKWMDSPCKEDPSKTNAEYHGIDKDMAISKYEEVRKEYYKVLGKAATKHFFGYATKMAAFKLVKILVSECIKEFKLKCIDPIIDRVKRIIRNVMGRLKEVFDTFLSSTFGNLLSTLLDLLLSMLVNTTKNIFKLLRQLISPLFKALKILFSNKDTINLSDRIKAASKVLGYAVIGALGIALEEIVHTLLMSNVFTAPLADILSPIIIGLFTSIISVLVIQLFKRYKNNIEFHKKVSNVKHVVCKLNDIQIIKSGISTIKATQSVAMAHNAVGYVTSFADSCIMNITNVNNNVKDRNKVDYQFITATQNNCDEIDDLLNNMNL